MAGIVRYGTYVPFFRLTRAAIGGGRGERAAASYDEDSVSMAVEASRDALAAMPDGHSIDRLIFATTSPPYVEKLDAATVHAALDLPKAVEAVDVGGSSRAGLSSLLLALDLGEAGRTSLVASADVVVGAPSGPRESGGPAGVAKREAGAPRE